MNNFSKKFLFFLKKIGSIFFEVFSSIGEIVFFLIDAIKYLFTGCIEFFLVRFLPDASHQLVVCLAGVPASRAHSSPQFFFVLFFVKGFSILGCTNFRGLPRPGPFKVANPIIEQVAASLLSGDCCTSHPPAIFPPNLRSPACFI